MKFFTLFMSFYLLILIAASCYGKPFLNGQSKLLLELTGEGEESPRSGKGAGSMSDEGKTLEDSMMEEQLSLMPCCNYGKSLTGNYAQNLPLEIHFSIWQPPKR